MTTQQIFVPKHKTDTSIKIKLNKGVINLLFVAEINSLLHDIY